MKPVIPKADLVHGEYYYGHCRNANTARWNAETNKFYYWRNKFGQRFVEDINHPEDDDGFDLFLCHEPVTWGTPAIPFPKEKENETHSI